MTTFSQNFNNLVEATLQDPRMKKEQEIEMMEDKVQSIDESAKSQDFFQDNKAIKTKYTTTIKSRNFLTNIAYVGINKEDYYNKNLIFDVYLLLTKNLNPFSLDRKLTDKTKHEMIYMLWRECMPIEYYKFICEEKNFMYLNGKDVLQPKGLQIIADFIEKNKKTLNFCKIVFLGTRAYSNMFIPTFIQKFTARPKKEVSI